MIIYLVYFGRDGEEGYLAAGFDAEYKAAQYITKNYPYLSYKHHFADEYRHLMTGFDASDTSTKWARIDLFEIK
jgi:hypothetical protein